MNHGIARNVDGDESQHGMATLGFRGLTVRGVFSAYEKRLPMAYYGTLFNDPRTKETYDRQYIDVVYQHSLGEKWQLASQTSFDQARFELPLANTAGRPDGFSHENLDRTSIHFTSKLLMLAKAHNGGLIATPEDGMFRCRCLRNILKSPKG